VGVGEIARDGGRYPLAIDLNSKMCTGTSFQQAPRGCPSRLRDRQSSGKISRSALLLP